MPSSYARGHVRAPNKNHLMHLKWLEHGRHLRALRQDTPPAWDSRDHHVIGPIKDQGQCGSCHSENTEVLTERGWVLWPEYDWRTPLGTMNLASGRLEFQGPLVQHIYDHDGPMYYYEGRSTDFALTPDHRMVVSRNDKPWSKVRVADLPQYVDIPHATSGWAGTELETLGVGDRVYRGDDLLALVALVISDGHVGHLDDGNGGRNQIAFCCFNESRVEAVRALAHRLGIPEQSSRPGVWYFRDGDLAEWFRQNAYVGASFKAPDKHVPALIKCASQRQIAHFLQFFGDQHTQAYGGRRFYSCSGLMMDDLQELLLRIGKRGTIEEHQPRSGGINAQGRTIEGQHPEFTLTERQRDGLCLERENLHEDHYKGKVYCATVPNGTLVTRRNKRVLISSNCWDFSGTGVVEVAYYMAGIFPNDGSKAFSEEYTLSCGSNGGCNGDDNVNVLDWAKKTGLPLSSDYGPYNASAGQCHYKTGMQLYKIDDWGFADSNGGNGVTPTPMIKTAIVTYGCVGCAVAAGGDSFWDSGTGTGTGHSHSIDHDVIIVGWDDNHDNGDGSKGAWIMRNSWGTGWGNSGYAWVKYGAYDLGTEAVWAVVKNPNPPAPPLNWIP
jgi:hypothetical protein